ncbi:hypothetical protein NEHOM01_0643 [Nematocida homosporus]|uniref:uncharacterized protein n=1 Tax=Nematocida homosporus TaxID=1912981 RepID=UPI00222088A3|nr:uncharacterized protein NEHOM01_0643 [Nematocida homosporus]KAI5185138.1 hypothetical protein NEHOM01_0643 [Nematocida homosporus]
MKTPFLLQYMRVPHTVIQSLAQNFMDPVAKTELNQPWLEELDESSLDSKEFFKNAAPIATETDSEVSSAEDCWSDEIGAEDKPDWHVPKLTIPISARASVPLRGSTLDYNLVKGVFTSSTSLIKIDKNGDLFYFLDTLGRIYVQGKDKQVDLLEMQTPEGRPCLFVDLISLSDSTIVALGRKCPTLFVIKQGRVREVKVPKHEGKSKKIRKYDVNDYMVISGLSIFIYYGSTHLVRYRLDFEEEVLDAYYLASEKMVYILLSSRVVKYSMELRARLGQSGILVGALSLGFSKDLVLVGLASGLSLMDSQSLQEREHISNLANVDRIITMESLNVIVYGSSEGVNGLRLINARTQQVIANFPGGRGLGRVTAFAEGPKGLLFAEGRVVSLLSPKGPVTES